MASQNTKKERLRQNIADFKTSSREWMDQNIWDPVERFVDFEYEHAAPGPHMAAIFCIVFGLGHAFGIGAIEKTPAEGLAFWTVYAGIFLWGYSHNDEGRKIIGENIEAFGSKVGSMAGSFALTLVKAIDYVLPDIGFRAIGWMERIVTLIGIGTLGFASYTIFPFVAGISVQLAPSMPATLLLTHAMIISTLPFTLALLVFQPFRRILFMRYSRWPKWAAIMLALVQLAAIMNLAVMGAAF